MKTRPKFFIILLWILSMTISSEGAVDAVALDDIHAGTAWEAYSRGDFIGAERQFQLLITLAEQSAVNTKSEEVMNLKLGLAYTLMKLSGMGSSNELDTSPEDSAAPPDKLLLSSKEIFADLIGQGYKLTDCVPAILGIVSKLKDYSTMDKYLPMVDALFPGPQSDRFNYLFVESAWASYHAEEYLVSQNKFEALLQKDPGNMSLVTGLGYTLYQQHKYEAAYDLLQHPGVENSPEIVQLKSMVCGKLSDPGTPDGMKGRYSSPGGGDVVVYHRHKNGDDGTSRLDETSVSANLRKPFTVDKSTDWGLWLKSRALSNGKSGHSDMDGTGSFYRSLNGQRVQFISDNNDLVVYEAGIKWKKQGAFDLKKRVFDLEVCLGTSPIGGAVDVTPVFTVKAVQGKWTADIHRTGVNDSILSIGGLDDPYGEQSLGSTVTEDQSSDSAWGRVLKNGISIGRNFSLGEKNWFSLNGGFDEFRGVNVWHNSALQINAAGGRTIALGNGDELTFGIYATWMHFDHNSNFYTFGHGGYYSPDFMFTAGPLFRYKTAPCRKYWLDLQLSLGWMTERNADAPRYPIHYEIVDEFKKSALDELQGVYEGDNNDGMVCSIKMEGWKIVTDHLAAGSFFSMGASSEDLEWRLGVAIEYNFNVRDLFLGQEGATGRAGGCGN